jgi:phosphohistidine phosphatase
MHRLILLRHGKAEATPAAGGGDFERGLTARGRRESAIIGRMLAEGGFRPDLVLVSTARRAMETWEQAAPAFPQARMAPMRELYHAGPAALAEAARERPGVVMIVGHNPGLHEFALMLAGGRAGPLAGGFPTAAAAVFNGEADGMALERFLTPREQEGAA